MAPEMTYLLDHDVPIYWPRFGLIIDLIIDPIYDPVLDPEMVYLMTPFWTPKWTHLWPRNGPIYWAIIDPILGARTGK